MAKRTLRIDLSETTALVTGGSKGIGNAIARALAENGARVALHYNTSAGPAGEFVQEFPNAVAVQADLADPGAITSMFDEISGTVGDVDILVNNAGGQIELVEIEDVGLDTWNAAIALNLTSAMVCSQCVIPGMKRRRWGRIINISSISARSGGGPGGASYAVAKGGMDTLTKGLAKELGAYNITVNAIAPGVILTAIHERFSTPEKLEQLKEKTALKRLGQPEDIAGAALFLASDQAAYVTGAFVAINGGLRMD